ncbi:PLP-dependent aminotransferase family protein [Brevibacillus massiliensis]|uniref:MocR-like pyridoxine biosynthesis transcription factor PdxR n=1 Tax=Brevibacillus massiliensis TaxID=1118054 RepID=UPI0002E036BE|nr:PLP-dependent aminotransferase family protein [Brevibacillus massiliensis]
MAQLDWKPDKASPVPLYRQIAAYVKEKIASGEWPVNSKIPPQRTLARAFEVNRSTVVTALEELTAEGFLEGRSGSGTVVANSSWTTLTAVPPPDWNAYVNAGIHKPNLPTIQEINKAEFHPGVIRLGTGELGPELQPKEWMREMLGRVSGKIESLGYEQPKGLPALREQISRYAKSLGIEASPSAVLVVSGALQALQLISLGILHRGSSILLEKPSYLSSLHLFQSAGMRLHGMPMDGQGLITSHLQAYLRQHQAAMLYTIPSFHNPTGILMTAQRRQELLKVCEAERLPIVEDDVYRELWLDTPAPPPLKAADKSGLVLYLGSMSKSLSPGLRIGWLIGPEPVIERLADIKMQTDYGSSSLSQWAAAEWLASGRYQEHIAWVREQLKKRREAAIQALDAHYSDMAEWSMPAGGFYIWLRFTVGMPIRKLFERALEAGILINPGSVYDQGAAQYLRLSYSYASPDELQSGLARLAEIARTLAE